MAERVPEHAPGGERDCLGPERKPDGQGDVHQDASNSLLQAVRPPNLHNDLVPILQILIPKLGRLRHGIHGDLEESGVA